MATVKTTIFLLGIGLLTQAVAQEDAEQDATSSDAESAQSESAPNLTLPPRISDQALPEPGASSLAPAPDEREDMLEAVVTGGQRDFNLPDLGTSFRNDEEERDPNQRIEVSFLNLYDPENRDPAEEAFPSLEEQLGVGMLRVFRLRFGNREATEAD